MKTMLCNARKHLHFIHVMLGMMIIHPAVQAQEKKYIPLIFNGKATVLNTSLVLAPKYYRGSAPLTISPEKGQRCSLEITQTSVLESAKLIVKAGAQLRVRGALLRECQIIAEDGSEVVIESSVLERCEFGADPGNVKTPPSLRITNCIIQGGGWLSASNRLGLEMMDCSVKDQLSKTHAMRASIGGEHTPLSLARRPGIRFTKFENCIIHPTLLLTISQVTIEGCKSLFGSDMTLFATGADTTTEVKLPVRWVNNVPESPPLIGGGVSIQRIMEPISGGCTLVAKSEGGGLSLEGLVNTPPELIKDFIPAKKSEAAPVITTNSAPTNTSVKLKQAHVNGLLVMTLATGQEAGQLTKMNVTAVSGTSSLRFSQYVGGDMATALREVQKFVQLRHKSLPPDTDLEIAFEEKYSDKDGPSAAVACTLLAESVLTGKTWDPTFAVTGDMNADGAVQPVGGVAAKVRGAIKASCKIVAIPAKNESAISDILVLDGPAALANIHIFGLEHFDQAVNLGSSKDRPTGLQQATSEFEIIRGVLMRDPRQLVSILRTAQAISRLQAIAEKAPNSLSAKYLLLYAQGRAPTTLSLAGSLDASDKNALTLVSSIQNDFQGAVNTLKQDELGGALNRLRNLRPRLDQRVWSYVDALVDYGEIVRSEVLNPARTQAKFMEMAGRARQAASIVVAAKKSLLADPQVREDLGL